MDTILGGCLEPYGGGCLEGTSGLDCRAAFAGGTLTVHSLSEEAERVDNSADPNDRDSQSGFCDIWIGLRTCGLDKNKSNVPQHDPKNMVLL